MKFIFEKLAKVISGSEVEVYPDDGHNLIFLTLRSSLREQFLLQRPPLNGFDPFCVVF